MTTPNASWLPQPPDSHRSVKLRTDGFFGPDDPCLWPQLLYPGGEHLACIRMNDPDPESGVSFCRRGISIDSDSDRTQDGSHKLNPASYARCSTHAAALIERTKTLPSSDRSALDKLVTFLRNALKQLRIFVGIAKHLKYRFSVFSRLYLELDAYVNYHAIALSTATTDSVLKKDFIGAFTFSPDQANILYQQGVPVWYIRSKKVAAEESPRLVESLHPRWPGSEMPWFGGQVMALTIDQPLEPFFAGPVSDPAYLTTIREWNLRYTFDPTSQAWNPQYDPNAASVTKLHFPIAHVTGKRRTQGDGSFLNAKPPCKRQRNGKSKLDPTYCSKPSC